MGELPAGRGASERWFSGFGGPRGRGEQRVVGEWPAAPGAAWLRGCSGNLRPAEGRRAARRAPMRVPQKRGTRTGASADKTGPGTVAEDTCGDF